MKKMTCAILFLGPLILQAQVRGHVADSSRHPLDSAQTLKTAEITGTRPIVERKLDRTTFNVENSAIAGSGTAWEALEKASGIQIRSDNSIAADKKSVQVYLDGKPLHLTGDDLANYLQGMPASLISKIEVFSNPPANFDAEGGAVINIVTKKIKTQGLGITGNAGGTEASYTSYNAGALISYHKDRLNIYGNYAYTDKKFVRIQDDYVTYSNPTGPTFWDSRGHNLIESHTNSYNAGADYQLAKNQTISLTTTGTIREGTLTTTTPTTITDLNSQALDSTLQTTAQTTNHSHRQLYGLNYGAKFDSAKKTLNFDLDYSPYHYSQLQYVNNSTSYPDGHPTADNYHIFTNSGQQIRIEWGNIDYTQHLGKNWTMSTGAKYSNISTDSRFDYYDNAVAPPQYEPGNSDHFIYTEKTSALYASFSGSIGPVTLEGGLRGEDTHTKGYSVNLDSTSLRNYFKLFPTLFVDYKTDENHEWQFRYSYRVDRPGYALLNPAKHYANPYNYLAGNPALEPSYIQNIELAYVIHKNYTVSAFYTATHDFFSNVTVQDNTNDLFYDTFENLDLSMSTGLKFAVVIKPFPWWEMSNTIEGYYAQEKSAYLSGSYNYHTLSYDGNTLQSFTIDRHNGLKCEVSGFYYSPGIQAIFKAAHYSELDAGVKINVLKGQGTLKLAANDIFYGNTYHIRVNYLAQNNGFYQSNDTRNWSLTFTYRFGGKSAAMQKRAAAEEEKRLQ